MPHSFVPMTRVNRQPAKKDDADDKAIQAQYNAISERHGRRRLMDLIKVLLAPTILSLSKSPVGIEQLLLRWFDMWSTRQDVLVLLLAPLYAPFMYSEHGFASTFQSAEALHDLVLATRDVARSDHRTRVDAVVKALTDAAMDPEVVQWAGRVLQSRNDKPLGRKIADLTLSTGGVGEAVLRADPDFGANIASARTGVSHGGAGNPLGSTGRYWYGQVLRWVVRARLLSDLIEDPEEATRRVADRQSFLHALNEVSAIAISDGAAGDG